MLILVGIVVYLLLSLAFGVAYAQQCDRIMKEDGTKIGSLSVITIALCGVLFSLLWPIWVACRVARLLLPDSD